MIEDTDPIGVESGELRLLPSVSVVEVEDQNAGYTQISREEFSGGDILNGIELQENDTWTGTFETDYVLPDGEYTVAFRKQAPNGTHPAVDIQLDGTQVWAAAADALTSTLNWSTISGLDLDAVGQLAAGDHNLEFQMGSGSGALELDILALRDDRYPHPLDNTVDADYYLSTPQLYPDVATVQFATATPPQPVTAATVVLSVDDTSGGQFIEISGGGGNTWHRTDNSATASAAFAEATTSIDVRVGLSRYGTRDTATPTEGYLGQAIDSYELQVSLDAISPDATNAATVGATVDENTVDGETLREAAQLTDAGDALTRSTFAELDVIQDMLVISSETISWENA